MDERPTTEFVLPNSQTRVVIYNYLTIREARQIRAVFLKDVKVKVDTGAENPTDSIPTDMELNAATAMDAQEKTLGFLLKEVHTASGQSYNGQEALDYVNNLPEEDGDFLFQKVDSTSKKSELSKADKKK